MDTNEPRPTAPDWFWVILTLVVFVPIGTVVSTLITWPAILDMNDGRPVDWSTVISLTAFFVMCPAYILVSNFFRTRVDVSPLGIEKRGLFSASSIDWSEQPSIDLRGDRLTVRGSKETIVVYLRAFRRPDELEEFIRSHAGAQDA